MRSPLACSLPLALSPALLLGVLVPATTRAQDWHPYLPLDPGNFWVFLDEVDQRLTIRVANEIEIDGESCRRITWNDTMLGDEYQAEIWCPRAEGLALVAKEVGDRSFPIEGEAWLLRSPLEVGATWTTEITVAQRPQQLTGTVLSEDTLSTPAGELRALKVRLEQIGSRIDRWYAERIGLVQEETVVLGRELGRKQLAEMPTLKPDIPPDAPCMRKDLLITRDGDVIRTKRPYRIQGKRVLYHNVSGALLALRLDEIDLQATEAAQRARCAPPPSARPRVTARPARPVRRIEVPSSQPIPEPDDAEAPRIERGADSERATADDVIDSLARIGLERGQLEELRRDPTAFRQMALTVMVLAGELEQRTGQLNDRYDLSTEAGIRAAAPELDGIAEYVEDQARAQNDPRIQALIGAIASGFRDAARLARESPAEAAEQYRERGLGPPP